MRVFLGWSGDESKAVAVALKDWLKMVCNAFDPWYSEMIDKGARWSPAIAENLRDSKAGVFVVTPDNLSSEWLHFEAGAIANVPGAKVCTYLLRVTDVSVKEPLRAFQHTKAGDQADNLQMVKTLWRQLPAEESRLSEAELERSFTRWWPEVAEKLAAIKPPAGGAVVPKPSTDDVLAEILTTVRGLDARDRERADPVRRFREMAARYGIRPTAGEQAAALRRLRGPHALGGSIGDLLYSDAELDADHEAELNASFGDGLPAPDAPPPSLEDALLRAKNARRRRASEQVPPAEPAKPARAASMPPGPPGPPEER